jgi:hypothetical protein
MGTASHTKVYCDCIQSVHASVYYFTILCCSGGLHFCANKGYTGLSREPEQESLVGLCMESIGVECLLNRCMNGCRSRQHWWRWWRAGGIVR